MSCFLFNFCISSSRKKKQQHLFQLMQFLLNVISYLRAFKMFGEKKACLMTLVIWRWGFILFWLVGMWQDKGMTNVRWFIFIMLFNFAQTQGSGKSVLGSPGYMAGEIQIVAQISQSECHLLKILSFLSSLMLCGFWLQTASESTAINHSPRTVIN